jgi:hypothetical protein
MIPEKTVRKYIAVRALAEQGSPGERDNAARVAERMEKDHPGLRRQADDYIRAMNRPPESQAPRGAPPGVHPKPGFRRQGWDGFQGNWENIFQHAAEWYTHVASSVVNAVVGTHLARRHVRTQKKMSRYADTILLTVRIPTGVVEHLHQLNPAQKAAFRQAVREMVEAELLDLTDDH